MPHIDFETLERVVGDVSHTAPAVKGIFTFVMKYLNKSKMTEMLQAGEHQLHLASLILEHKQVKKLLGGNHTTLVDNYAQLHGARDAFEDKLASLEATDIWNKFTVAQDISSWRQSDWAKLGLALKDGKLVPVKATLRCPSEQTLVAPSAATERLDKEGESDDELCGSLPIVRFDDMKSLELHEMQDLMSDGSGPSVPPKKPNRIGKLFKGKGRAEATA